MAPRLEQVVGPDDLEALDDRLSIGELRDDRLERSKLGDRVRGSGAPSASSLRTTIVEPSVLHLLAQQRDAHDVLLVGVLRSPAM